MSIYTLIAREIYGTATPTKTQVDDAKNRLFGHAYGRSDSQLAEIIERLNLYPQFDTGA